MILPSPVDFGLPEKFNGWRPGQDELVMRLLESDRRFNVLEAATGTGKSLTYIALATLLGGRWCVLTSTKGLQNQLFQDFENMGMVDVRGKRNYDCIYLQYSGEYGGRCDIAPCHSGMVCQYQLPQGTGCHYYDAVERAKRSNLVVTNYAYWLAINHYTDEGLGEFDGLILDEAHGVPEEVSSFLAMELLPAQLELLGGRHPQSHETLQPWVDWAASKLQAVEIRIQQLRRASNSTRADAARYMEHKRLLVDLKRIARIRDTDKWVISRIGQQGSRHWGVEIQPRWPREYTEPHLFRSIDKIVFSSATVRPKTLELLGVDMRDVTYLETGSAFPVKSRPVIYIPTADVTRRGTESDFKWWCHRADQIVKGRSDRKGIFHTVSYERVKKFMLQTKLATKGVFYTNLNDSTHKMVNKYLKAKPPAVMVTPSLSTGYDFPGTDCEYQIIGKVAFPDTRSAIMKARCSEDKDYGPYLAMQNLIQSCGRGMRSASDRCETLVIDNSFWWFIWKYKDFAPQWFLDSVRKEDSVPEPLRKL